MLRWIVEKKASAVGNPARMTASDDNSTILLVAVFVAIAVMVSCTLLGYVFSSLGVLSVSTDSVCDDAENDDNSQIQEQRR